MPTPDYAETANLSENELRELFAHGDGPERVWSGWRLALALGAAAAAPIAATTREHATAGVRRQLLVVLAGLGEWELVAELATVDRDDSVRGTGLQLLIQRGDPRDQAPAESIINGGGNGVDEVAAALAPVIGRLGWAHDPVRYATHPRDVVRSRFVRACCAEPARLDPRLVAQWYAHAVAVAGPELADVLRALSRRLGWAEVDALTSGATGLPLPPIAVAEVLAVAAATSDTATILHLTASANADVRHRLVFRVTQTWAGSIPRELQIGLATHASSWILETGADPDVATLIRCHEALRTCQWEGWFERGANGLWFDEREWWQGVDTSQAQAHCAERARAIATRARELTCEVERTDFGDDVMSFAAQTRAELATAVADLRSRWSRPGDAPALASALAEFSEATAELVEALGSVG